MGQEREYGKAYPVAKAIVKPVANLLWRIHVTGLGNVPATGPAIMCPNHISFFDSIVLPTVLPRRISYVGKAEYMDSWKTKYVFPAVGMVPIDRAGGSASQRALDTAARILDRGELFGIYPEGTRSRDGVLHRGRTGAARLALRTGAPLVPVGICGTDRIQPAGASIPRPFLSCQVNIGTPIDVTRYLDRSRDRMILRQLVDEVMFEVRKLSGQDYVDTYAGSKTTEPAPQGTPEETTVREPSPTGAPAATKERAVEERPVEERSVEERRVLVLPDGSEPADDTALIDLRASSVDVLAKWWS